MSERIFKKGMDQVLRALLDIESEKEKDKENKHLMICILKEDIDSKFAAKKAGSAFQGYKMVKEFNEELERLIEEGWVLCVKENDKVIGYALPWHDEDKAGKLFGIAQKEETRIFHIAGDRIL